MQRNIKKYISILETSRSENSKDSSFVINKIIHNHLTVALDTMHVMQYNDTDFKRNCFWKHVILLNWPYIMLCDRVCT